MGDVKILRNFNLMDYSLLLVVEYNPNYVSVNEDKFKSDDKGMIKPLELKNPPENKF